MNNKTDLISIRFILALAAGLAASAISGHAQSATASLSGVPVAGGYDYTLTLNNTGATMLNSFWYGWTLGGNNLPSNPSSPGNNLGWGNSVVGGNSIEWVNTTGTALLSGHSGIFTFFSTSTPLQMTTPPAGESVAYVNGIDFSQGLAGDSTAVFSPTLIPEPSTFTLIMTALLGLFVALRRKFPAREFGRLLSMRRTA